MVSGDIRAKKLRKIAGLLAGANCGDCGFENCGRFAVAVVDSKVSPVACRRSRDSLAEICEVLGVPVPETGEDMNGAGRRHGGGHGHRGYNHRHRGHHGHHR